MGVSNDLGRIERIETIPFRIPLRSAIVFATGTLSSADHILVRVTDADGAIGQAEAIPRPMIHGETVGGVLAVYEEEIRPRFVGRDLWDLERFRQDLQTLIANETAKAAFELACYDLIGQRLGVSCHRLLGGYAPDLVVSAILGYGAPAQVADEAVAYRETHGMTAFKVKVGTDVARDIATCQQVRAAVGPDAIVYVDANHGYDVFDALRFSRAVAELDLAWIEEPCPADRPFDRARVVREGGLTVLGDESCVTPADVAREVLAGRSQAVSLKVARVGYLGGDAVRGFCDAVGVPVIMGSQGDSGIGTLTSLAYAAAHPGTTRYPAEYSYFLHLADDLLAEPLVIDNGRLQVPMQPGAGIELDEDKLRHYRIE